MIIGIYGYGPFGQFMHKYLVKYFPKYEIIVTSRTLYSICEYVSENDFFTSHIDIIIFCNSIESFDEVIGMIATKYPSFFENKLIIDTLSVKEYPLEIYKKYNICNNILLTHPMFGPSSVEDDDLWTNKNFVFYPINIKLHAVFDKFIDFLHFTKCNLILMDPQSHDKYVAESQFITHYISRSLDISDTPINTTSFDSLLKITTNIKKDTLYLFRGMYHYNKYTKKVLNDIIYSIHKTKNMLIPQKPVYSATSIMMDKIKKSDKPIINAAIGVPSWGPVISSDFTNDYSLSGGNVDLKEEIVEFFSVNDKKLSTNNILITSGGKPALYCAIQAFTQISSSWLVPTPYWVSYPDMIATLHGNTIFIESTVEKDWLFDIDIVESHFQNEQVNGIIICNPNNPTGLMYPKDFLDKIVILADKYNKKIIIDEVYLPLISANGLDYKNSLYFSSSNVISVWSFSKGWGMAGWRLGFVLAESNIIKKITGIQSTINTCPPMASQQLALKILQDKWLPVEEFKKINKYKKILIDIYRKKGWIVPDNDITSMYIFPINYHIDINRYIDTLFEKGLAIISGEPFGNKYGVRLTIYNNEIIMNKYIQIIEEN